MKRLPLFITLLVLTLALDQGVKGWVRSAIPPHGSLGGKPFPGFFELTLTYNEGIAFGMLQGSALFMTPIAIIIAVGATIYSYRHPEEGTVSHVSMALLASGALGNLYDRVVAGRVTDMFWFRAIDFPVFNIADTCITIATILLIYIWWREAMKESAKNKAAVEAASVETGN